MDNSSGVGVLDKAVLVLRAVQAGPASLADLVSRTSLARPTAHRLALALEHHGLLARDSLGRFVVGSAVHELAAAEPDDLVARAAPVVRRLRDETGESAQLFVRRGDERVCVLAAEPRAGLRDTVPVGTALPMTAGSGAQVFVAWSDDGERFLPDAAFTARTLAAVRRRGWGESVGQREAGVASVSAPVLDRSGAVVASLSISGPIDRLGRAPGRRFGALLVEAARDLSSPCS